MSKFLAKLPGATAKFAGPRLKTFLKYARVELKPPGPRDWPEIQRGFQNLAAAAKSGRWKQLSVKEAWLNTLVGAEIAFWFFAGEVIGRRHFIGYYVKP